MASEKSEAVEQGPGMPELASQPGRQEREEDCADLLERTKPVSWLNARSGSLGKRPSTSGTRHESISSSVQPDITGLPQPPLKEKTNSIQNHPGTPTGKWHCTRRGRRSTRIPPSIASTNSRRIITAAEMSVVIAKPKHVSNAKRPRWSRACCECEKWYGSDGCGGIYSNRKEHENKTCRHKHRHYDDDDDSLWEISFPED